MNKAVSNRTRCPIMSWYYWVSIITCIHVSGEYNQYQYIIIYYVNEHQLPHVIDAFHTMPTTHVNQDSKLLKSVEVTLFML